MTFVGFTRRQLTVAALVASAKTDKSIAAELSIKDRRVRSIVRAIAERIGADPDRNTRIQIALWYKTTYSGLVR